MPKKSKNESKIVATPAADPLSSSASTNAVATQKRSKASKTGSPKRATKKAARSAASNAPSDEEVRVRAYLLAERRIRMALQGDPAADWLEAREQLIAEAQQKQA